jgi:hypothetical protein
MERRTLHCRRGHSFIELMTALLCSALILVGLGSVIAIALQTADAPNASKSALAAARGLNWLTDELQYATVLTWSLEDGDDAIEEGRAIEFVVADRDDPTDGRSERIRYDWSGTAGAPLVRTQFGDDPGDSSDEVVSEVVEAVDSCAFSLAKINGQTTLGISVELPLSEEAAQQNPPPPKPRIDTSIRLTTTAERLDAYWRVNVDSGDFPTTTDRDGDCFYDWIPGSGVYRSNPAKSFNGAVVLEFRGRHNSAQSGGGPVVRLQTAWGMLGVRLQSQADSSQTLTLFRNASTAVRIVENLSPDMVTVRLEIDCAAESAKLYVNDEDIGQLLGPTLTYDVTSNGAASHHVEISNNASAEFEFFDVRVVRD